MKNSKLLGEFYKHCLNIASNVKPNNAEPYFNIGWNTCYITPYLTKNEVTHIEFSNYSTIYPDYPQGFYNSLIHTLKNYKKFIMYYQGDDLIDDVISKINQLLHFIEILDEEELIILINANYKYYPTAGITITDSYVPENFNKGLIDKINKNKRLLDDLNYVKNIDILNQYPNYYSNITYNTNAITSPVLV
jgi:hypothetical protein